MTDARQEIEVPFGGKTYKVRPTWKTLAAIEAQTGMGCYDLGIRLLSVGQQGAPQASLSQIVVVMFVLVGELAKCNVDEIGEALVEDGYDDLILPLGRFLVQARRGNKQHEREAREAAKDGAAGPRAVA